MERTFTDQLGVTWTVMTVPVDDVPDDIEEEVLIRCTAEGTDDREIRARGAVEERFDSLTQSDLQLAVEAAGNQAGFLFLHPQEGFWWVRSPEEDPLSDGARLSFSDLEDEYFYGGALSSDPGSMSEDELQEALDEVRGQTSP